MSDFAVALLWESRRLRIGIGGSPSPCVRVRASRARASLRSQSHRAGLKRFCMCGGARRADREEQRREHPGAAGERAARTHALLVPPNDLLLQVIIGCLPTSGERHRPESGPVRWRRRLTTNWRGPTRSRTTGSTPVGESGVLDQDHHADCRGGGDSPGDPPVRSAGPDSGRHPAVVAGFLLS
jgi:hypothetical protein